MTYKVTVGLTSLQPITAARAASAQSQAQSATGAASATTQTSATTSQNATLKDGLTVAVNIVVQQKSDILVVPNRAITKQGQNNTVQVVKDTGTETRVVKIGMSDSSYTEITEGLTEGEQVIVKTSTSSTSSTSKSSGGVGIPGVGGPPPGGF